MQLTDLDPYFYGAGGEGITDSKTGKPKPERIGVGISFDCPCGCDTRCYIPFTNPLDGGKHCGGGHPTWKRTGDTFETLTLTPSILRIGGCKWHGFIRKGSIVNA